MSEPTSLAAAIAALLADIPHPSAPPTERAEWLRRKAALLRRIAGQATQPGQAGEARELADAAQREADRIEGGQ